MNENRYTHAMATTMTRPIRRQAMKLCFLSLLMLAQAGTAKANVQDASPEDTAWFAGQWATGPADIPGYETMAAAPDCSRAVTIHVIRDNVIARETRLRNGSLHRAEFSVKRFGQNFPWWPTDSTASAPVARRTGNDVFLLARTGDMGRADWERALQHTRCPATAKP